jgi:hypothetical protein
MKEQNVTPAEAATEVGQEDTNDDAMLDVLCILLKLAGIMVVILCIWWGALG